MTIDSFPIKVGGDIRAASCYWATPPGYSDTDRLKSWRGKETARQQNAVELAHLAASKWEATCEWGTVASSIAEMKAVIRNDPEAEVTAMMLLAAKWSDDTVLGVCLFHRTWAGNVFLDFLAAHPRTQGEVKGVGTALLYSVCHVSTSLNASILWGETASESSSFYTAAFGLEDLHDRLVVPLETQRKFCRQLESKWRDLR